VFLKVYQITEPQQLQSVHTCTYTPTHI